MLEIARHERDRGADCKFIYAGTSSCEHDIYAQPYTFTKWLGEEHCKMYNRVYGVPCAIARFFNVYGPREVEEGAYRNVLGVFKKQKAAGEPLTVTGDGSQKRDFVHVHDIVDGLIRMSEKNWAAETFNLGIGKNHSILEVAQMFDPVEIKFVERPLGEAEVTLADTHKAERLLGWKATRCLQDYIKDLPCLSK